jgi:hypothetical protein
MNPATVQLITALIQGLTTFLANHDRTDIPAEMQQALDQAHAELTRLGAGSGTPAQ